MTDQPTVKMLTPSQVEALQETDANVLLLDVRMPEEWDIHHIPGAVLMPMNTVMARVRELDPARTTVVICEHGMRSKMIADYLVNQAKFTSVANMVGGMSEWQGAVATGR